MTYFLIFILPPLVILDLFLGFVLGAKAGVYVTEKTGSEDAGGLVSMVTIFAWFSIQAAIATAIVENFL